jgi:excisionase family DNA binding protein
MKLISIDEAATVLAVSRATAQRLIDSGRLPAITIASGKRKRLQRVDEKDLYAFIEGLKTTKQNRDRIRLAP